MANRNGLNHKVRGFKGVGFNRALPAAFGWGNGISPTGSEYLTVPSMSGKATVNQFSIEFWAKGTNLGNTKRFLGIYGLSPNYDQIFDTSVTGANLWNVAVYGNAVTQAAAPLQVGLNHYVFVVDNSKITVYYNGSQSFVGNFTKTIKTIGTFRILAGNLQFPSPYFNSPIDEFRYYEIAVSSAQAFTNYNAGIGNNPSETEWLRIWYQFESFETLDFSLLQDGSDMRTGLRDMSGNKNHGLPFNMDTNPNSSTYVLKPF